MTTALDTTQRVELPEPVARRGLTEAQWRTLSGSLYPGAQPTSVLMVVDYCQARKLDPLKKPCHIVPMRVKDAKTGQYDWRDVVMPGIYELRTTAQRTGQYLGHSAPEYGPIASFAGVDAPEWCAMTIYRDHPVGRIEFPVRVYFREAVNTTKDGKANERWQRAPVQMLTKCTEAAGLREAFPDELGGEMTAEEMDGAPAPVEPPPPPKPAQRKSEQATSQPVAAAPVVEAEVVTTLPPTTPQIGKIAKLREQGGACLVELDTGFRAATKDEALILALKTAFDAGRRLELIVTPSSDPAKYAARIDEIIPDMLEVF